MRRLQIPGNALHSIDSMPARSRRPAEPLSRPPSPLSDEQRGWIRDIAARLRAPAPRNDDAAERPEDGPVSSPGRAFDAAGAPGASRA
jgi:hypothetical protein